MALTPGMITLDTTKPLELAAWWAAQTGGEIIAENEGWFVVVSVPGSPRLGFQKVDDPTPGKNRLHVDFVTDDVDRAVAGLRAAGAGHVADREMPGLKWVTLTDPDGNEFCVTARR